MASYETQLVGLNLLTLMAKMEARCQKQECDLKEILLSKLLNRLSEQLGTKAVETSNKLGVKPAKSRSKANPYTHFIVNYFLRKLLIIH
jgi:hypothetical protein